MVATREGQQLVGGSRRQKMPRHYQVVGNELSVYVTVRDRRPEVSYIGVQENVVFRETSKRADQGEPLVVKAQTLSVQNADSEQAEIDVVGQPAMVSASGMSIEAEKMRLNRGKGNVWIDSPGQVQAMLDRDFRGNPLPTPQPMTITWQKNMELDQGRITFRGKVRAVAHRWGAQHRADGGRARQAGAIRWCLRPAAHEHRADSNVGKAFTRNSTRTRSVRSDFAAGDAVGIDQGEPAHRGDRGGRTGRELSRCILSGGDPMKQFCAGRWKR